MRKNLLHASLINAHEISIVYISNYTSVENVDFYLIKENQKLSLRKEINNRTSIPEVKLICREEIELGYDYRVMSSEDESVYLDYDDYVLTPEFDEYYAYEGDDLGVTYTKESSTFKVWSPLSDRVYLKLEKKEQENSFLLYEMNREEHGVFTLRLKGDLFNKKYAYMVRVNGREHQILDPYAKGTSLNSEYSVVIDLDIVKSLGTVEPETKFEQYNDAIIYELNIRDFTETAKVDHPGTYTGLIEKVDYLKRLGITHVQLLPVLDFATGDDLLKDVYNWGYDPVGFFCLEGSYSSFPEDPISRLIEFKNLVNELHKNDIRVILDVVYNHLYDYINTGFQANVPFYYFRRYKNKVCNASGCGNDFASEKKMARKIIIDSIKYLIETFDVDGFRFDLMGLIDVETTNEAFKVAKELKPNIMFYGEGWHMGTNLPEDQKSSMVNADKLPGIAFFNDSFRDLIKGSTFNHEEKGYVSGNLEYRTPVEHVLLGSVINNKFTDTCQSINYVECHDNQTLYDKLACIHADKAEILKRVKFANALLMFALGTPLIHMGQEIGLSKCGLDNTYNVKGVNNMDWKLVEERKEMIDYLADLIKVRKKFSLFKLRKPSDILKTFDMFQLPNGIMSIAIRDPKFLDISKKAVIIVNPNEKTLPVEFDDYLRLYLGSGGLTTKEYIVKSCLAPAGTVCIFLLV